MLCKVCNTRVRRGESSCPNCGSHSLSSVAGSDSDGAVKLPQFDVEATQPDAVDEEVELALGHATAEDRSAAPELDLPKKEPPPARPQPTVDRARPLGTPEPEAVRRLLAERPDLLETGLAVYKSEKGKRLGVGYMSAVGEIDLLARDANGGLVIVMVAEPHEGPELISMVLQRVGWVRKHLGGGNRPVRAIVLLDQERDEIGYAAAAVSDTVAFKTYRTTLTFEDLRF